MQFNTASSPDSAADQIGRSWSTDDVAHGQRLDYWVGAICEAFLEMDCSSREAQSFAGRLTSVPVETIALNQVVASTQDVYRTPSAIARSSELPFYLITQTHNAWYVRQNGSITQLRAGDAVLVDSAQPYELHFPESVGCLSIQLPRPWVGQWLTQLDSPSPRVALKDQGWGKSLSALCTQLGEAPDLALAYPAALLSDQLGAMLASALEPLLQPRRPVFDDAATRVQDVMHASFNYPGLTAQQVADQAGLSVRSLHRRFAAQGKTFGNALRQHRLDHAASLLRQPRLAGLSIAEIGRRCGFSDPSHFVREFHLQWGATPGRYKAQRAS